MCWWCNRKMKYQRSTWGFGASFAGARSMTATSGGGFCLMVEGIGLAGIAEYTCGDCRCTEAGGPR
jgi:hypothetical protein